jgi:hypothetical protein
LKTPGADDNIPRSSVKDVYTQIINDLKEAETAFGRTEMKDAYHASKLATQALLARVYLYMEDWNNAIKYSDLVIDKIPLSYGKDYLDMFNNNVAGKEAIFRLNGSLKNSPLSKFYNRLTPVALASDTLISLFDNPDDIRLLLFDEEAGSNSSYVTLKYTITAGVSELDKHYDPYVLRSSEMYLIRAEANLNKNNLKQAATDLKLLIARNLNTDVDSVTLPETDKNALTSILRKERAKELCFEGHQFFDITRWKQDLVRSANSNSNVRFLQYPNDRFVLPIPQAELEANKNMVGNPTVNY